MHQKNESGAFANVVPGIGTAGARQTSETRQGRLPVAPQTRQSEEAHAEARRSSLL